MTYIYRYTTASLYDSEEISGWTMLKDIGWKTNLYIYIFKYHIAFNAQKREKSTCLFVYIFIFKYFQPSKHLPFYIHPSNKNDMTGKEKSTVWHCLMRHRRTKNRKWALNFKWMNEECRVHCLATVDDRYKKEQYWTPTGRMNDWSWATIKSLYRWNKM